MSNVAAGTTIRCIPYLPHPPARSPTHHHPEVSRGHLWALLGKSTHFLELRSVPEHVQKFPGVAPAAADRSDGCLGHMRRRRQSGSGGGSAPGK